MVRIRGLTWIAIIAGLFLTVCGAHQASAHGDDPYEPGRNLYLQTPNGESQTGYAGWNANAAEDWLMLSVDTGELGNDRCIEAIFDWHVNGHVHYDSRIVRVCKDNGHRDNINHKIEPAQDFLSGMAVFGTCLWHDGGDYRLDCHNANDSLRSAFGVPGEWHHPSVRMWTRLEGGSVDYWSAGNSRDPSA